MYSPSQWITWSRGPRITAVHLPPSRTSIVISSSAILYSGPPYQSAKRSGSVHSRQTSSRGASKVQFMSMSGLGASVIATAQSALHSLEAALPEAAVALDPIGGVLERLGLEVGGAELRGLTSRDQPGTLQHLEVLRHRLDADRKGLSEFADGGVALGEPLQDRPPRRVGESGEGAIELRRRHRRGI